MIVRKSIWVFGALATAIVLLTQFCSPPNQNSASSYLNHNDSVGYVGMETCASCHLDKVQTFLHTGMGMSFDTVSRSKSSANLSTRHVLYDSFNNFYYFPFWKGEQLYVKEFRLEDDDTIYQRTEAISYIIGSGQHTNSHLIKKGDYIVQAPFTWYAQDHKLDFPPGFEDGANSRFSRVIDQECMSCHNGLPKMVPASKKAFSYVPKGIDCERCHGPGELHVKNRQEGITPEGDIDYAIVNPSKLSWERQIDVCQRCHLQGNNVLKEGKSFSDFKPGMKLADVFEIYLPKYEGDEQLFNMANHADRFQHSQCFIKSNESNNQFTCITCHNPHVSVKETATSSFINACRSCHVTEDAGCTEDIAARLKANDNCITCHMPKSGTEDIPHVTVHDHKIGVHRNKLQHDDSEVVGLYSVNNQNPDPQTMIRAYLTYYEKFDPLPIYRVQAKKLLDEVNDNALWVHYYYQTQEWQQIVNVVETNKWSGEKSAITCYRIGKAYNGLNKLSKAVEWLNLAVLTEPSAFTYKSELGAALIKIKQFDNAEKVLEKAMAQYDNYVPTYNNLGYVYVLMGKYSKAKRVLLQSLQLDPDNVKAKENLVLLYSQLSDVQNELKWLKEVLKQNPNHDVAKMRYAQLSKAQ